MINLPTPCVQSWDNMTPVDGGRHCASCNKVIPDFTQKTEEEILEHLSNGQTCGHFRADQITDGATHGSWQHYFKWKHAIALLLMGSLFLTACRRRTTGIVAKWDDPPKHKSKEGKHGKRELREKWFTNNKDND